jgi:hypothetical protein
MTQMLRAEWLRLRRWPTLYVAAALMLVTVLYGLLLTVTRAALAVRNGMVATRAFYWLAPIRAIGLGLGTLHLVGALVMVYVGCTWCNDDIQGAVALARMSTSSPVRLARARAVSLLLFVAVSVALCCVEVAIVASRWTGAMPWSWINVEAMGQALLAWAALALWALLGAALAVAAASPLISIPLLAWVLFGLLIDLWIPALAPYSPTATKDALLAWALPDWTGPGATDPAAVVVTPATHTASGLPYLPDHFHLVVVWVVYMLVAYAIFISAFIWRSARLRGPAWSETAPRATGD